MEIEVLRTFTARDGRDGNPLGREAAILREAMSP
jgi:hypothetical protein